MKNHAKRSLRVAGVVFATVALSALMILTGPFTKIAKADDETSLEEIHKKARLNGVRWCYVGITNINSNDGKKTYTGSNAPDGEKNKPEVVYTIESNYSWKDIAPHNKDDDGVYLPNSLAGNKDNDEDVNCYHLFNGGDGLDNIYKVFGKESEAKVNAASSAAARDKFFTGMGYTKKTSGSDATKHCIRLKYNYEQYDGDKRKPGTEKTGLLGSQTCFEIGSGGTFENKWDDVTWNDESRTESNLDVYLIAKGGWGDDYYEPHMRYFVADKYDDYYYPWEFNTDGGYNLGGEFSNNAVKLTGLSWDDIKKSLNDYFGSSNLGGYISSGLYDDKPLKANMKDEGVTAVVTKLTYVVEEDGQSKDVTYEIGGSTDERKEAYRKALSYLSGKSYPPVKLTDSEKIILYQYYLKTLQKGNIVCDDPEASGEDVTWFVSRSEKKSCKINYSSDGKEDYSYVDDSKRPSNADYTNEYEGILNNAGSAKTILSELNKLTATATTVTAVDDSRYFGAGDGANETAANLSSEATIDSNSAATRDPDCYTATGALGWVVCPIIDGLGHFVESFYTGFIEPNLLIEPELISPNSSISSGATYKIWSKIRTIANISFFLVLLVVVFSQVTGVGINNYGIKKILPKLIIGVLLVNLSYIICQIAVDLSNIIGSSIGRIFESVMTGALSGDPVPELTGGKVAAQVGVALVVGVLAALAGTAFVAVSGGGWAIVMMLLSGLVSVALAFLTLWAMLCIRKALVIILVITSPLAFVCYMLPNLKKTYDFWFKLFKGLLIAYPICSLLVYGGSMVGTILIHASSGADAGSKVGICIAAAITSVVPIFFVPKIVTSSLGALSGIVAKAAGGFRKSIGGIANDRLNKGYIGTRARMGKAAYDRRFKRSEYRAAQDVLAGNSLGTVLGRTAKETGRAALHPLQTRRGNSARTLRSLQTEASRLTSGYQRAEEAPEIDSYNLMGVDATAKDLAAQLGRAGTSDFDIVKVSAAIQSLQKANKYDVLNKTLEENSGKLASISSKRDVRKIAEVLGADKKNNAAAGYYAKALTSWNETREEGSFVDFATYMSGTNSDASFAKDMQNAGADIISSQDDSALSYANSFNGGAAMQAHTVQQFMSANGNLDVKQLREFNAAVKNMDSTTLGNFIGDLSTQQMSNTSVDTLSEIGGSAANSTMASSITSAMSAGNFGDSTTDPARKAAQQQMMRNYQAAKAAYNAASDTAARTGYENLMKAIVGAATMSMNNGGAFDGIAKDTNGAFTGSMSGSMKFAMGLSDTLPPINTGSAARSAPVPNPNPWGAPIPPPPGPGANPPHPGGGPHP